MTATPPPETVTIPRTEYQRLLHAAMFAETLDSSPHVAELIAEYLDWNERRILGETSHAISAGLDWRAAARVPTYAELERRRQLTTDTPCGTCRRTVTLVHPLPDELAARLPDLSSARCQQCSTLRAVAA